MCSRTKNKQNTKIKNTKSCHSFMRPLNVAAVVAAGCDCITSKWRICATNRMELYEIF